MTKPRSNETPQILGMRLWSRSVESLVSESLSELEARRADGRSPFVFACANPHSLTVAESDPEFKRALRAADAVVADGVGVTVIARAVYGIDSLPRITGSDYFHGVMRELDSRGGSAAFFGSSPAVLQLIEARCRERYPNVRLVAMISPPYGDWSAELDSCYLRAINEASPDVLWVGMTAPRQEKWAEANRARIHAPLVGSIGAVFDYFAGTVRRAPAWVCRAGFEWAYRFVREPRRLWERNLLSAPRFVGLALRDRAGFRRTGATRPAST